MKPPFVLQNIRVHGLGDIVDSPWIKIGNGITFFELPEDFNTSGFLRTLQSINPPHSLADDGIFQNYPKIIRQGKYQKRVRPEKRTVAFAIFIAQPVMVQELAEITPHLYETDRVEVGRRLDYSRWVNFVEIASSTRWSEVDQGLLQLAKRYPGEISGELYERLSALEKTDRLEDDLVEVVSHWLENLKKNTGSGERDEIEELLFAVKRQNHFTLAKQLVRKRLPCFLAADPEKIVQYAESSLNKRNGNSGFRPDTLFLERMDSDIHVLLVDETAVDLANNHKEQFRHLLKEASHDFQILYFVSKSDAGTFPEQSTVIRYADMVSKEQGA